MPPRPSVSAPRRGGLPRLPGQRQIAQPLGKDGNHRPDHPGEAAQCPILRVRPFQTDRLSRVRRHQAHGEEGPQPQERAAQDRPEQPEGQPERQRAPVGGGHRLAGVEQLPDDDRRLQLLREDLPVVRPELLDRLRHVPVVDPEDPADLEPLRVQLPFLRLGEGAGEQAETVRVDGEAGRVHPGVVGGGQRVVAAPVGVRALDVAVELAEAAPFAGGVLTAVDPQLNRAQGAFAPAPGVGAEDGVGVDPGADRGVRDLHREGGGKHEERPDVAGDAPQHPADGRGHRIAGDGGGGGGGVDRLGRGAGVGRGAGRSGVHRIHSFHGASPHTPGCTHDEGAVTRAPRPW